MTEASGVDVRRAGSRARTVTSWLDSRHSLSFGPHYDPANTSYGLLLAHNEDRVAVGAGYATHLHRDVEVVTWVLAGALVHRDSTGQEHVLRPGAVQRMSAGSGIEHSETNDAHLLDARQPVGPVHFVQAWVLPDEVGGPPELAQADVTGALAAGGLVPVVSGRAEHDRALHLRSGSAALLVGRLSPGEVVSLPDAAYVHLFVPRGTVELEHVGRLDAGDAARLTGCAGHRVTAVAAAEVLVWEMHADRPAG